jgi:2-succinyl-6-hydroxy-2,4-cyclohexadiene-1-carboxylate synthase
MMEQVEIRRAKIDVNGVKLFYRDTASDLPPLLCLHGRWGRGETWTDLMSRLGDRYRIIAPDQRGHGLSDRPVARYASQDLASDAYGLMEQLGLGPTIVVGHSMGGRVAAHVAATYPHLVRALAILDEGADGPQHLSSMPPEDVPNVDPLTSKWPTPYPSYEEALRDLSSRFTSTGVRYFLESLVETVEGYDFLFSPYAMSAIATYHQQWFEILPRIQCPVLLVRATESWCLSKEVAERMRPMIRDCTYFEVSQSDHMVYVDNPDQFYPGFEQFLDIASPGGAGEASRRKA